MKILPSKRTLVKLVRDVGLAAIAGAVAFLVGPDGIDKLNLDPMYAMFMVTTVNLIYRTVRGALGAEPTA